MAKKRAVRIINTILIFVGVVIISIFSCKLDRSIEQQIAQELDMKETDISLFDTRAFGEYQIAGICYGLNQYGMALWTNKNDKSELIWVKTSETMLRRAENVWVEVMSVKEGPFYAFLSANPGLSSIVLENEEGVTTVHINHSPSLKIVFHEEGSNSYQLVGKNGTVLQ